ncbi:MAG: amidohydrolase family protein, partial [Verrucomicrobiota bacterium]|nr:amidohydrolase family protein [Verrucomicrobiota bacterium]
IGSPLAALGDLADGGAPEYEGKQEEIISQWKENLVALAEKCPNVVVKIGGLLMPQLGHKLDQREVPASSEELATLFGPLYLFVIETFGPERCMFESNFPVDKVSTNYTILWNMFKRMTTGMPDADRLQLFSGTAKRIYRLDPGAIDNPGDKKRSSYVVSKV